MKYIFVFILFFPFLCSAQDFPVFEEEDANPPPSESLEETAPLDIEAIESQISEEDLTETTQAVEEIPTSGDFEVFRPSEDISEDLSVPFPADI